MPEGRPLDYLLPLGQLFTESEVFGPSAPAAPLPAAQPGMEQATGLDIARILGMAQQREQAVAQEARGEQTADLWDWLPEGAQNWISEEGATFDVAPVERDTDAWGQPIYGPMEHNPQALAEQVRRPQVPGPVLPEPEPGQLVVAEGSPLEMSDVEAHTVPQEGPGTGGIPGRARLQRQGVSAGGAQSAWRIRRAPPGTLTPSGLPAETLIYGPGLETPLPLSSAASRNFDHLHAEIGPYMMRGGDIGEAGGGLNARLPSGADETIATLVESYLGTLGPQAPAGAGAPPGDAAGFSMQARGPVSAHIRSGLEQMPSIIAGAEDRHIAATQTVNAGQQQAEAALAQLQLRMAEEGQRRAEAVAQRSQQRLAALDQTLADVQAMRVDPNAFYGGPAGRITATIAVALGQLGSILTGGPNVALETINAGIERNMAAQQANIQNARAGAQQQQSALDQFRAILGDEEAAQAATRAAMLTAYQTQLSSIMTGLRGPQLQAAQQLEGLLRQQAMMYQQAAHEREAYTAGIEMQGAPQDVRRLMEGSAAMVPQPMGAAQPQVQAVPEPPEPQMPPYAFPPDEPGVTTLDVNEGEEAGPVAQANIRPGDAPRNPAFPSLTGLQADAIEAPRPQRQPRRQRTAPNAAGQVPQRTRSEAAPFQPQSLEDFRSARADYNQAQREGGRNATGTPDGTILSGTQGAAERFNAVNSFPPRATTEVVTRYHDTMEEFDELQRSIPQILAVREEYHGELTQSNRDVQRARALAENIRNEFRVRLTGAAAPPDEIERILNFIPDPSEITATSVAGLWDAVLGRLESYYVTRMQRVESRMNRYGGLQPDNARGQDYWSTSNLRNAIRLQRVVERGRARGRPVNR